jgi:hypothetical protein
MKDYCDFNMFAMQGLNDIKRRPDILSKIKFDVTPKMVMEPRFQRDPEDLKKLASITGYMFYIETQCQPPVLMLMKIGRTDISSTVGKIDEIPAEMIQRAIEKPVHSSVHGMYAVTDEIKEWLTKELGL